ncbi:methylenetetrahydrofolate reductase C-terminal domain-containing protein [Nocardia sp. NPDC059246]|uniref:methylenetetrahydrofolate reductase C-terminal domain-containing protein n=1 Tax=unclassified Nocardia TaxID=2637762 RepID=UPI0036AD87B1
MGKSSTGHAWPKPKDPGISARWSYRLHSILVPNRLYRWFAELLERKPRAYRAFTAVERVSKEKLFGCQMCGQCALPVTGYACPMTCPKQLRNGPCGGVSSDGRCEVYPEVRCVWALGYERAERAGRATDFDLLQLPVDNRERDRSSWVNYWLGRDDDLAVTVEPRPALVSKPALRLSIEVISR